MCEMLQNIFSAETALRQSGLNHTAAVSDFLMVLPPTKKFVMQLEQVDVLEAVFPATVGVVNALDKFLAVPQLFLTGLQVLMKIMSIFPHQLRTCVTTALKRF